MAAFNAHEHGEPARLAGRENLRRRGAERQFRRMAANLLQNAVDECQRPVREAALPGSWFRPDGEELRGQVAAACGGEVQVAGAEFGDEVPALVHKALGGVGVGIDEECGGVDRGGIGSVRHRSIQFSCPQSLVQL